MAEQNYIYLEIEKQLLDKIYNGSYQYGDLLPSENEIAGTFNVARMTAHKALKNLEAKGIIYAKKGSGYYVSQLVNDRHTTLKSFTESVEGEKAKLVTKLLVYKQIAIDDEETRFIAKKLLCSPNETFHYFERLRIQGNKLKAYERGWVPMSRIPKLDIKCLSRSFYSYIENELKLVIKGGNCVVSVEMSDEKLDKLFNYSESKPLIRCDEITCLDNGLPFEYNLSYYDGEKTKITVYRDRNRK